MNIETTRPYQGKLAIVLGATGSNGREMTRRLHAGGATLLCVGRNRAKLRRLRSNFPGVSTFGFDLTDWDRIDPFVTWVKSFDRQVDMLFHLAGAPILDTPKTTEAQRIGIFDSHVNVPTEILARLLDSKLFNKGAVVGLVSSTGSAFPSKGAKKTYNDAKKGVNAWFARNQSSYKAQDIRLVLILMGMVKTGMSNTSEAHELAFWFQNIKDKYSHTPAQAVETILADVERGETVSYPGWRAELAIWEDGEARLRKSERHKALQMKLMFVLEAWTRKPSHWLHHRKMLRIEQQGES